MMRLKAPAVAVGATLAGGVAYADEPVTIAFDNGGYRIEFADSGTIVKVSGDRLSAIWNPRDKQPVDPEPIVDEAPQDDFAYGFELDASGLEAASKGHRFTVDGLDKAESSRFVIDGLDKACAVVAIGTDDELGIVLGITDRVVLRANAVTVHDGASGGAVTVTPAGFKVEIEGFQIVTPLSTSVVGLPDHLGLSVIDPDGSTQGSVCLGGVQVPTLTVRGRTTGSKVVALHAGDVIIEGGHFGVGVRDSVIDRMFVDGILTGSSSNTVIGEYDGPDSFHHDLPFVKPGDGGGPK